MQCYTINYHYSPCEGNHKKTRALGASNFYLLAAFMLSLTCYMSTSIALGVAKELLDEGLLLRRCSVLSDQGSTIPVQYQAWYECMLYSHFLQEGNKTQKDFAKDDKVLVGMNIMVRAISAYNRHHKQLCQDLSNAREIIAIKTCI